MEEVEGISIIRASRIIGCTYAYVYQLVRDGYLDVVGTGKMRKGTGWGKLVSLKQVLEYKELREKTIALKHRFARKTKRKEIPNVALASADEKVLEQAANIILNSDFIGEKEVAAKLFAIVDRIKRAPMGKCEVK